MPALRLRAMRQQRHSKRNHQLGILAPVGEQALFTHLIRNLECELSGSRMCHPIPLFANNARSMVMRYVTSHLRSATAIALCHRDIFTGLESFNQIDATACGVCFVVIS